MPVVSMKELLEAGVHFGHQTRRWNPKMKRFIFTERGGIYIIDLQQTQALLDEAYEFARAVAQRNGSVLFVGTKKQAQDAVSGEAARVGMPYVNHRWLGGLLTNWRTMSDRIQRLHELRDNPFFRRTMTVMTLVWGLGLIAHTTVNCILVFRVSIPTYLAIAPIIGYAFTGALIAFTFLYARRAERLGTARRAAAEAAAGVADAAPGVVTEPASS